MASIAAIQYYMSIYPLCKDLSFALFDHQLQVDFKNGGREVESHVNLFAMDKFESMQCKLHSPVYTFVFRRRLSDLHFRLNAQSSRCLGTTARLRLFTRRSESGWHSHSQGNHFRILHQRRWSCTHDTGPIRVSQCLKRERYGTYTLDVVMRHSFCVN